MEDTIFIPAVEFEMQAVVQNFPKELHEAIIVTPELLEWAAAIVPIARARRDVAKSQERAALCVSRGEASWRAAGGPSKSICADHWVHIVNLLELLACGKNSSSWDGWVDRSEWRSIVEAVQ